MLSKEIDVDTLRLTDKLVYIIGPLKLQNEMMASLIEEETEIKCLLVEDVHHIPGLDDKEIVQHKLILWDCLGKDAEICLAELEQLFDRERAAVERHEYLDVPSGDVPRWLVV